MPAKIKVKKPIEKPIEPIKPVVSEKTIAELVNANGDVIFSFSKEKNGYNWVELSMGIAKRKGLEVKFR